MKRLIVLSILAICITVSAWAGSCPAWTSCPLDGAQANLVNTEYQGTTAIGVYEHVTTTGEVHKFRQRCN